MFHVYLRIIRAPISWIADGTPLAQTFGARVNTFLYVERISVSDRIKEINKFDYEECVCFICDIYILHVWIGNYVLYIV